MSSSNIRESQNAYSSPFHIRYTSKTCSTRQGFQVCALGTFQWRLWDITIWLGDSDVELELYVFPSWCYHSPNFLLVACTVSQKEDQCIKPDTNDEVHFIWLVLRWITWVTSSMVPWIEFDGSSLEYVVQLIYMFWKERVNSSRKSVSQRMTF